MMVFFVFALTEPAAEAAGDATTATAGYQWTPQPSLGSTGTSQMYGIIYRLSVVVYFLCYYIWH